MYNKYFDERQILMRYKSGMQAYFFCIVLVGANAIAAVSGYTYANPGLQAILIIMLSSIFFQVMCTVKGAYIGKDVKKPMTVIAPSVIAGAVFLYFAISRIIKHGEIYLVMDGELAPGVVVLAFGISEGLIGVTNLIMHFKNKR